jgi:Domain of unknown function (DUF5664)
MTYTDHKETASIFGHDYKGRKNIPIYSFLTRYFPKALVAVVNVCVAGNRQHNKDLDPTDIHWAREKSTDQLNTAMRHLLDHGTMGERDDDGQYHLAKAAWRILAELELLIERDAAAGPATGVRDPKQPVPEATRLVFCSCKKRVFHTTDKLGEISPQVVAGGVLHTVTGCSHV